MSPANATDPTVRTRSLTFAGYDLRRLSITWV